MREPFISVIPQLLPQVKLNENRLKYQAGRAKLADDMEAVLNAKGAKSAPEQTGILRNAAPQPPPQTSLAETPALIPAKPSAETIQPPHDNARLPGLLWAAAGVTVLALAWFALRKRRAT